MAMTDKFTGYSALEHIFGITSSCELHSQVSSQTSCWMLVCCPVYFFGIISYELLDVGLLSCVFLE